MSGPETVRRHDIDGVEYDAPLDVTCADCGDTTAADFERSYYGLPTGWEAYSPESGYRGGVVCGPCVKRLLDEAMTALRHAPDDFTWRPGEPFNGGLGL